mmetsp:Transcript_57680/g.132418  ORF Transcript_57680/g.132418 Transcript_57680/m.132418 type:complete len:157 (-) Transcript_57680:264-734(-)
MSSLTLAQQAYATWRGTSMDCSSPAASSSSHSAHGKADTALEVVEPADAIALHAAGVSDTPRAWAWHTILPPLPLQRSPALFPDSDLDVLLRHLRTSSEVPINCHSHSRRWLGERVANSSSSIADYSRSGDRFEPQDITTSSCISASLDPSASLEL